MSADPSNIQLLTSELQATLKCDILTPDSPGYAESILRWNDAVPNNAVRLSDDYSKGIH